MNSRYRRGGMWAADMEHYSRLMSLENTNDKTITTLKRNLIIALRQELTETQRKYINLYYIERLNMREIAEQEGVNKSTVSRTILRGEDRLRKCLRFGAAELLREVEEPAPYRKVEGLAKREGYENVPEEENVHTVRRRPLRHSKQKKKKEVRDSYVDDY